MRHRVSGKKLNRTTSHRKALWRNMAVALFQHGAIRTTETKAKELRRFVEKIITTARKGTLHARRMVLAELGRDRRMYDDEGEQQDQTVVQKLFDEIAPRYAERPGGYTRIIRLAERRIGDAGKQVILQLVEEGAGAGRDEGQGQSRRRRRAAKRHEAAGAAVKAPPKDVQEAEEAPLAPEPAEAVESEAADDAPQGDAEQDPAENKDQDS